MNRSPSIAHGFEWLALCASLALGEACAFGAAEGNYETPAKLRAFLAEKRISLSPEDRAELETLLPAKTPVLVSEL